MTTMTGSSFRKILCGVVWAALSLVGSGARADIISLTGAVVYDGANDGYGWTSSTILSGSYLIHYKTLR